MKARRVSPWLIVPAGLAVYAAVAVLHPVREPPAGFAAPHEVGAEVPPSGPAVKGHYPPPRTVRGGRTAAEWAGLLEDPGLWIPTGPEGTSPELEKFGLVCGILGEMGPEGAPFLLRILLEEHAREGPNEPWRTSTALASVSYIDPADRDVIELFLAPRYEQFDDKPPNLQVRPHARAILARLRRD
jgi:hypothetical protein